MESKTKLLIGCLACLVVGYIAGREHVKYEMRTALQAAATEMKRGLASIGSPLPAPPALRAKAEEQPLSVALVKKGFDPKDIHNRKFEDEITLTIRFDNKTGKNIRAFDGVLIFTDLLDNEILGSRVAINEPIPEGSSLTWEGALEYNQFMDDHQRLRGEPKENLKLSFVAGKVLFEDGSTKSYE